MAAGLLAYRANVVADAVVDFDAESTGRDATSRWDTSTGTRRRNCHHADALVHRNMKEEKHSC